jgi:hypothetical protein
LVYNWQKHGQLRSFAIAHIFIVLMLALTAYSQFGITPHMRELRTEMQTAENLSPTDSRRVEFDNLHAWSTRLEGGVLLLGLGVVVLTARRFGNSN